MKSTLGLAATGIVLGAAAGAALGYWEARPWDLIDVPPPVGAASKPAERKSGPVATVPETTYEFGNMESGTTKRHSFSVKNAGDEPMLLVYLSHTCKCTNVEMGDKSVEPNAQLVLKPGEETKITLEWAAKVPPGPFRHGADFSTTDPQASRISFTVEGEIVASTTLVPAAMVFGSIRAGDEGRAELLVMSFLEPEVKIESTEVREPDLAKHLTITVEDVAKADIPDKNAEAAVRIVGVYKAPGAIGPFAGSVRVTTNLKKAPTLEIPVAGSVRGDISLFGHGWNETSGVLHMEPMTSETGGSARLNITVRGEHAAETELKVAKVEPAEMKAELGQRRQMGDRLMQQPLIVSIPAGTRPMVRGGEDQGGVAEVVLSSTHPMTPEVRLRVQFTVKP